LNLILTFFVVLVYKMDLQPKHQGMPAHPGYGAYLHSASSNPHQLISVPSVAAGRSVGLPLPEWTDDLSMLQMPVFDRNAYGMPVPAKAKNKKGKKVSRVGKQ